MNNYPFVLDEKYNDLTLQLIGRHCTYFWISDLIRIIPPEINSHNLVLELKGGILKVYYINYESSHELQIRYTGNNIPYVLYRVLKLISRRKGVNYPFQSKNLVDNDTYKRIGSMPKTKTDLLVFKLKDEEFKITYYDNQWIGRSNGKVISNENFVDMLEILCNTIYY